MLKQDHAELNSEPALRHGLTGNNFHKLFHIKTLRRRATAHSAILLHPRGLGPRDAPRLQGADFLVRLPADPAELERGETGSRSGVKRPHVRRSPAAGMAARRAKQSGTPRAPAGRAASRSPAEYTTGRRRPSISPCQYYVTDDR